VKQYIVVSQKVKRNMKPDPDDEQSFQAEFQMQQAVGGPNAAPGHSKVEF
jgi:hypothetical protein